MTNVSELIIAELEIFNQSIKDSLDGKNITNTGTAKKSIRIEVDNNSYKSIGIFYLEFLDSGRGSGGIPPINKIQNWVKTKLGVTDEKESLSIAFAVAKKIQKLGTEIFENPAKGIQLDEKIAELKKNIESKIAEKTVVDITRGLNLFKNRR